MINSLKWILVEGLTGRILRLFVILFFVLLHWGLGAQTAHNFRKDADKQYTRGSYTEAEEKYRKALEKNPEVKGHFNLGNSLFNLQRYDEAREQYDLAIASSDDEAIQARAYYNKGNSFFNEQQLAESIEEYKKALRLDPQDEAARNNLFLSKQLLKQQEEQEQQQQDQQDQQEQEQNEDQEQNEQEQKEENQEQEEQKEENQEEQEQQEKEQSARKDSTEMQEKQVQADSLMQKQINREELMKLLKAIEEEDKKIQQKLRRGSGKKTKSEKDW